MAFPTIEELFTGNSRDGLERTGLEADLAGDIHETPFFTSKRHRYTWLRRRLKAGLEVDEEDLDFMEQFRDGGFYRLVGKDWENQLDAIMGAGNEG